MKKTYYGAQTKQALENFPFSAPPVHKELIYAIAQIKKAAALANEQGGYLSPQIAKAIARASDEILEGKHDDQFPLSSMQGGAGTSTHMNVNEVIAARASEIIGDNTVIHPNDHVNMAQSTNDVNPSALKIACLLLGETLLGELQKTVEAFEQKSSEFADIHKLGRTHFQDAVPITLGSEFASHASLLSRGARRIQKALETCLELNLGGTAVGNSINAPKDYREAVYVQLSAITGKKLISADNLMALTCSQSDFVSLSQSLVAFSLDASKIACDMRLMVSGPAGGLSEIVLPSLQPGSSIMPGKVNPVMPEAVNQLYYMVSGNNLTIEHAANASFFELANMFPILADRLISSIKITSEMMTQFRKKCILGIQANESRCRQLLEQSTAYATLLTPVLGYDTVSSIVKEAVASSLSIRQIVLEKKLLTEVEFDEATRVIA